MEKLSTLVARGKETAKQLAPVVRRPGLWSCVHEDNKGMNQKKAEQIAESVSHPNTHRLNLLLRDVIQGPHLRRMGSTGAQSLNSQITFIACLWTVPSLLWEELGKKHKGSSPLPRTDTVEYSSRVGVSSCGGQLSDVLSLYSTPQPACSIHVVLPWLFLMLTILHISKDLYKLKHISLTELCSLGHIIFYFLLELV